MARSQAIHLPVEELFAFEDVAGDTNLVGLTFGPGARVTALLASAPLRGQCFPVLGWQVFEGKKEGWASHTIVTFEDGTLASTEYAVVMAGQPRRFVEAFPLLNRTWLLPGLRSHIVVDGSGAEVHQADAPHGIFAQVTPDGRIWSGFYDQMMAHHSQWDGVVCIDWTGEVLFRFEDDVVRTRSAPSMWDCDAINVVSDSEVWVSYYDGGGGPIKTNWQSLVRLIDYRVSAIYPWRDIAGKSRTYPTSFAVTSDSVLFQTHAKTIRSDVRSETSSYAHLCLSSLISGVSAEYLPVDQNGQWIGTFRSIGRESFFYLITDAKLYRVNAAELP